MCGEFMKIKNKEIIVTGGAGFIGSNLVEELCKENKVYVIDNLHTGSEENLKEAMKTGNVTFIKDDSKNIRKHNIKADIVFHLGIYSSSPMYKENPLLVSEAIAGMINVLEYAKENNSTVVFASTSSIYNGLKPPHKEDMIPLVTDFYTEARIAMERLSELYSKLYSVNVAAMRFFSVYGKHEAAKKVYANLITQFIIAMKENKQPVIYGDGSQKRDFIYVTDVVEALILATKIKGFDVFNVGTGKNYSLNEIIQKINTAMGKSIKPKYIPMPIKNYVMETLADTKKSEEKLGFKAKIDVDKGIMLQIKEYC
jgi:UDP-glucose 4-epimerase